MAGKTGTLSLADLAAVTFASAASFGLDRIAEAITADLEVHNGIVREITTEMMDTTADVQRTSGASNAGRMEETTEHGRAKTQKAPLGSTVAFPLRLFQRNIGWTRKWFQQHTPAEMALQQNNNKKAHLLEIERQVKRAMFLSANYNWVDVLDKGVTLAVKRFANADGAAIGDDVNGNVIDGATHQHYIATGTMTAAGLTSLINTILEHNSGATVRIAFSATDETAVRALTGFIAMIDTRLTINANANQPTERLNFRNPGNRQIGYFLSAEIWIKPWGIANYGLGWDASAGTKPLVMRERSAGSSGLAIAAELDGYPLHAQFQEAEFGIAVANRVAGGAWYFANATFADPTIP